MKPLLLTAICLATACGGDPPLTPISDDECNPVGTYVIEGHWQNAGTCGLVSPDDDTMGTFTITETVSGDYIIAGNGGQTDVSGSIILDSAGNCQISFLEIEDTPSYYAEWSGTMVATPQGDVSGSALLYYIDLNIECSQPYTIDGYYGI